MASTLQDVRNKIELEGFEYTFINYSSWDDVPNPEFRKLKLAYVTAQRALEEFIDKNTSEIDEEEE
jgi:hypothetical protein